MVWNAAAANTLWGLVYRQYGLFERLRTINFKVGQGSTVAEVHSNLEILYELCNLLSTLPHPSQLQLVQLETAKILVNVRDNINVNDPVAGI